MINRLRAGGQTLKSAPFLLSPDPRIEACASSKSGSGVPGYLAVSALKRAQKPVAGMPKMLYSCL